MKKLAEIRRKGEMPLLLSLVVLRQVSFDGLEFDAAVRTASSTRGLLVEKVSTHWSNCMIAKL